MKILTNIELSKIFNVSNNAIIQLVQSGKIPYKSIEGNNILFSSDTIIKWVKNPASMNDDHYIEKLKHTLWEINPQTMKEIQNFSSHYPEPWEPKDFYLEKVKNKKLGFVYYVRYKENGNLVPSHWTTKTNDIDCANKYANANKDKLLTKYFNRDKVFKTYGTLYDILRKYYSANSEFLQIDLKRGKTLTEFTRSKYNNFILKQFIPYLKKNGINSFDSIDTPFLARFQNYLLCETNNKIGLKPQTIKIYLLVISQIFNHLVIAGQIKSNPCKNLIKIRINEERLRGCYEITILKGVFNKTWKNQLSYLLCLTIYSTGMRNIEIERLRVKDIILIDNIHFIDIKVSKTKNGIRIVPLHDFTYKKLISFIRKNNKKENDSVFLNSSQKKLGSSIYEQANSDLAEYTKYSGERLQKENITFYSGRHFWKTLMNAEKLGDIEEYFMGHSVSNDVSKRYNHKDKQGKKKLLDRSQKVFQILDKHLFK